MYGEDDCPDCGSVCYGHSVPVKRGPDVPVSDTWLSGGGVLPDQALPGGTRLRMRAGATAREDVDVYVGEDGRVHIVGHYGTVHAQRVEPNHVAVHVVPPGGGR